MIFASIAGMIVMQMIMQEYQNYQNRQNQERQGNYDQNMAMMNFQHNKNVLQNQIQWRTEDAKKAGIHPLAALGISPASGSRGFSSNIGGPAPFMAGQNINKLLQKYMNKEVIELQEQKEREELKRMRLENLALSKQIYGDTGNKDADQYGRVTAFDPATGKDINLPGQYEVRPKAYSEQFGYETGFSPKWQFAHNEKGELEAYISKDIAESMESDWFAAIMHTAKQVVNYTGRIGDYWFRKKEEWVVQELNRIRPKSKLKGMEFRYNPYKAVWTERKIEGRSKVWDTDKRGKMINY